MATSRGLGMGLKPPSGTRVMDSMPPAMKASPAPSWMAPAAIWIACMEEPQKRLTVVPATLWGRPASSPVSRATFSPCSPSGMAQPTIRSSISPPGTPVFCSRPWITAASMSSGRTRVSAPLAAKWKGERT